jgi:hypothetical protein
MVYYYVGIAKGESEGLRKKLRDEQESGRINQQTSRSKEREKATEPATIEARTVA